MIPEAVARVAFSARYLAMRKLGGLYLVPREKFSQIPTIRKMGLNPSALCSIAPHSNR